MKHMKSQQGFTLIELIVVIVILGILAVTAAPKFVSFTSDANKSAIAGVKGGIASAMSVYSAKAAIDGKETVAGPETISGVAMVYGYPDATAAGVIAATGLSAATTATADYVYFINATDKSIYLAPVGKVTIANTNASQTEITSTNCYILYTQASDANTAATVTVTSLGC
jgi:MSHA pilin protein MshA